MSSNLLIHRHELQFGDVIGRGSVGVVYKAVWRGSEVAVKAIANAGMGTGGVQQSQELLKELAIMSRMGYHPHIVPLVGMCQDRAGVLLVTEFVSGGSLLSMLQRRGTARPLSYRAVAELAAQAAAGVVHLHANGIVHRDLACRNILVCLDRAHSSACLGVTCRAWRGVERACAVAGGRSQRSCAGV